MSENLIEIIRRDKIYPIIRVNDFQKAIDISKALIDGGIRLLEINVENVSLYKTIAEISKYAQVCAGGIITSTQASYAVENGAIAFSSPIFQISLVKISKNTRVPYIAGATTANEAYEAWKSRIPLTKLFPAEAMGGVHYVESILRQMPFLNLMPTGNIKLNEVISYLNAGAKAVGIGRDFYQGLTYSEITEKAENILTDIRNLSKI